LSSIEHAVVGQIGSRQTIGATIVQTQTTWFHRFGGDDEDDEDKPELTKEEFMEALSLRSFLFYSEDVEVFFDDNDMFLGHSLIASDFDGENFNDAEICPTIWLE